MSVKSIIQSLKVLVSSHEELLSISKQKTEIVKEGSLEKLQSLLVKERKLVRMIEQKELKRMQEVEEWFRAKNLSPSDSTVTKILQVVENETEKEELESAATALTEVIGELKQQELLNQSLLKQSMQFVQMTMELLNPSISHMNYGNQNKPSQSEKRMNYSLFDSQA